ncbi:sigma 54-interacting transcriptional regulator [Sporolactobacillus sp. Y61]|uniref:Sigma 54-interacting transcriptional regulator n=1 Tax=Sporolactobacillus sp. Y61 TaxID=3160863 RepID=A0AAU8IF60_9BACL
MFSNVPISSLALPCDKMPDIHHLQAVPEHLSLSDLDDFSSKKDLVLVNREGRPVSWIPFERLTTFLFHRLIEVSAQYEALLESVDDAVTVVDKKENITGWNSGAERLYHYVEKDADDQPITHFFKKDALILMSVLHDGKKVNRKYNQPAPNVHVLINCHPIILGKQIIGAISVERNINDIVKLNESLSSTSAYIQHLESRLNNDQKNMPFHKIKGRSPALHTSIKLAKKVASTEASVLLTGESGVGKELFAQAIHQSSNRSAHPFVAINCGAIPANLFESELFGYTSGAFTGAAKEGKTGKMDAAKGGTLFLDEIGEMPMELQVKLLRVLQDNKFYRVGGNRPIPMNTRIIAATNRDLEQMIAQGQFRADLYYRLNVVSIRIPSLRERIEDIPELVQIYMKRFALKYKKRVPVLDPEVMVRFIQYPWPGNIRELSNTLERLIILSEKNRITKHLLPEAFYKDEKVNQKNEPALVQARSQKITEVSDKVKIRDALQRTYGNKAAAARLLGISRATLYNYLKKYFPNGIQILGKNTR